MNKNHLYLLLLVGVLILCTLLMPDFSQEDDSVVVFRYKPNELQVVEFKNTEHHYRIERENSLYKIINWKGANKQVSYGRSTTKHFFSNVIRIKYSYVIADLKDRKKYGLAGCDSYIKIIPKEEKEEILCIGDNNFNKKHTYVRKKGDSDDKIYVIKTYSLFGFYGNPKEFVTKKIVLTEKVNVETIHISFNRSFTPDFPLLYKKQGPNLHIYKNKSSNNKRLVWLLKHYPKVKYAILEKLVSKIWGLSLTYNVDYDFQDLRKGNKLLNIALYDVNEQLLSKITIYQMNKRNIKDFVKTEVKGLAAKVIYVESNYQRGIIKQTDWNDILAATKKIEKFLKYLDRSNK